MFVRCTYTGGILSAKEMNYLNFTNPIYTKLRNLNDKTDNEKANNTEATDLE